MRIYIFGDSFSIDMDMGKPEEVPVRYFLNQLQKGTIISEWPQLLRDDGHTVHNYAINGTDNISIFEKTLSFIDQYEKDDVIILGWSTTDRMRLYTTYNQCMEFNKHYTHDFLTLTRGFDNFHKFKQMKDVTYYKRIFEKYMEYRSLNDMTNLEVIKRIKIINKVFKKLNNVHVFHWFWNPHQFFYKNNEYNPWIEEMKTIDGFINLHFGKDSEWKKYEDDPIFFDQEGCSYKSSIYRETNGEFQDCHWSFNGHKIFHKIITDQLNKILN